MNATYSMHRARALIKCFTSFGKIAIGWDIFERIQYTQYKLHTNARALSACSHRIVCPCRTLSLYRVHRDTSALWRVEVGPRLFANFEVRVVAPFPVLCNRSRLT